MLLQLRPSQIHFPSTEARWRPSKITNDTTLGRAASILLAPSCMRCHGAITTINKTPGDLVASQLSLIFGTDTT